MSNRVYLRCTDFPDLPAESQLENFFAASGIEYEAKSCIPLFWMCLFSSADIRIRSANHDGFEDDSRPYAYLLCSRLTGIERLRNRARMLEQALGAERYALYLEWITRLESEVFHNILVRTEELDWMGEEGELENTLRKAYKHLEESSQQESFRMSNAMNDIAGLWQNEALRECEAHELVGTAITAQQWPPRFAAPAVPPPVMSPPAIQPSRVNTSNTIMIWQGMGFLGILIPFLISLIAEMMSDAMFGKGFYSGHPLLPAAALLISSVIVWFLGVKLNSSPGQTLLNPKTGQQFEFRKVHTTFWMPMQWFSVLIAAMALYIAFK